MKVLVVDDSFVMRVLISDLLRKNPHITQIDVARSGGEAIDKIITTRPDCIVLDLIMPGMDGLTLLKYIMKQYPTPTILFSAYTQKNAALTLDGLALGAISFVEKPSGELSLDIERVQDRLFIEINAVFENRHQHAHLSRPSKSPSPHVIVIGASTGGPQTIQKLLKALPTSFCTPIIIVQHLPDSFLNGFIYRLNKIDGLVVKRIEKREFLQAGVIYCMPGDSTLETTLENKSICLTLNPKSDPTNNLYCIDNVMISISSLIKEYTIGVVLSGSGQDGLLGMQAIKAQGGTTIAQNESALVFGMPRAVIEASLADFVLPLEKIIDTMLRVVTQ